MSVISIRKFLTQNTEGEQALLRVVHLLLEVIDKQAAAGDSEECARFRETISQFSAALGESTANAELLVQAGAVVKGFEEYAHFAAKQHRLQTAELQVMVKMLTATVRAIAASGSAQIRALGDIERRVTTASELDDVRLIKTALSDCLTGIRQESERQQRDTAETIEQLNQGLNDAKNRIRGAGTIELLDEVTGLPGRPAAEAALVKAGQEGPQSYAAVMVLDRLQALNARFGRDVGDGVLAMFADFVRKNLRPEDRLFRWGGPTLLVVLPRQDNIDCVRNEVARMMATRLEHTIQTPSRSLLVPVSARWSVLPAMAATRLICQRIDAFTAAPARE
jgi:diguanylate cyclase (GGDEF)-like protein